MKYRLPAAVGGLFVLILTAAAIIYWNYFAETGRLNKELESVPEVSDLVDLVAPNEPSDDENSEQIERESFENGKKQAAADIKKGKLIVYRNTVAGTGKKFETTMREKYGVEIIEKGDVVSLEEGAFNKGYNSVSVAEIERKFGPGILKKVETGSK